jgi:uncharacterized protein YjbJ (UPF0337 family)
VNKDRAEGKVKDIAGRVERQVGEWTGDTEAQVKGTVKQAEGKVQNAWGKAKDAVKKHDDAKPPRAADRGDNPEPDNVKDEDVKDESDNLRRRTG